MNVARAKLDLIKPEEVNMDEYEVSNSVFLSKIVDMSLSLTQKCFGLCRRTVIHCEMFSVLWLFLDLIYSELASA